MVLANASVSVGQQLTASVWAWVRCQCYVQAHADAHLHTAPWNCRGDELSGHSLLDHSPSLPATMLQPLCLLGVMCVMCM